MVMVMVMQQPTHDGFLIPVIEAERIYMGAVHLNEGCGSRAFGTILDEDRDGEDDFAFRNLTAEWSIFVLIEKATLT